MTDSPFTSNTELGETLAEKIVLMIMFYQWCQTSYLFGTLHQSETHRQNMRKTNWRNRARELELSASSPHCYWAHPSCSSWNTTTKNGSQRVPLPCGHSRFAAADRWLCLGWWVYFLNQLTLQIKYIYISPSVFSFFFFFFVFFFFFFCLLFWGWVRGGGGEERHWLTTRIKLISKYTRVPVCRLQLWFLFKFWISCENILKTASLFHI